MRRKTEKQLLAVREKVAGGILPPKGIDLFQLDGPGNRGRELNSKPIKITSQYPIRSHRKIIGIGISLFKRIVRRLLKWFIDPILDQINPLLNSFQGYFESHEQRLTEMQRRINAYQTYFESYEERFLDIERRIVAASSRLETSLTELEKTIKETHQSLVGTRESLAETNESLVETERSLVETNESLVKIEQQQADLTRQFQQSYDRLKDLFEYLSERMEYLEQQPIEEIKRMEQRIKVFEKDNISQRLNRAERFLRQFDSSEMKLPRKVKKSLKPTEKTIPRLGMDYFLFQEKFRGGEELISKRQQEYVELFRKHKPVLDIGCGRGEFLELLKKSGIESYGIDLDPDMIRLCEEKKLKVYREDALIHLGQVAPASLGGIFSSQVVEHFDLEELISLIDLSFDRLVPGGVFVAETLNPDSLSFLKFFYLDPTHIRPFPHETLQFLMESAGFLKIKAGFLNPVEANQKLQHFSPDPGFHNLIKKYTDQLNLNTTILNQYLFGPIDYFITAEKPSEEISGKSS